VQQHLSRLLPGCDDDGSVIIVSSVDARESITQTAAVCKFTNDGLPSLRAKASAIATADASCKARTYVETLSN
jgi:hypothetical protein